MLEDYECEKDGRIKEINLCMLVDVMKAGKEGELRDGDEEIFGDFGNTYEEVSRYLTEHIYGCFKCKNVYSTFVKAVDNIRRIKERLKPEDWVRLFVRGSRTN